MRKTSLVLAASLIAGIASQTPAFAGFGGASPLGQNPEQKITIAERQQLKRLYLKNGRKPFAGNPNQNLGDDAIAYQLRYEKAHGKRLKKRRLFSYGVK